MTHRRHLSVSAALLALVLTAACGTAGGADTSGTPKPTESSSSGLPKASAVCALGTPTYLVQPYAKAAVLEAAYAPMIAALSKAMGCRVKFEVAASLSGVLSAAARGQVTFAEFAGIGSGFAVRGKTPSIQALATYQSDFPHTPATFASTMWADKRFVDPHLMSLTGQELALTAQGSLTGDYLPRAALIEAGLISKVTLSYAGSHTAALQDFACPLRASEGAADCTKYNYAVFNTRVMGPAAKRHLWVPTPTRDIQIWHSDPIPYTMIGVSSRFSEDVRNELKASLLAVPAASVRSVARLLGFASALTGGGLVEMDRTAYCQDSNLDLCDVIRVLRLTPKTVSPLVGESL